jgi:hypothetical protein
VNYFKIFRVDSLRFVSIRYGKAGINGRVFAFGGLIPTLAARTPNRIVEFGLEFGVMSGLYFGAHIEVVVGAEAVELV